MFHDTVMSLVVVSVIIGMAVVWHQTADGTDAGILGPEYTEKADPASVSVIPRPDWYFYFLFYLLRIFEWPATVVLATVGIPTILMMLLFAVPFIDRSTERRLSRRPVAIVAAILTAVAMGVLTWKGATTAEFLASEAPTLAARVPGGEQPSRRGAGGRRALRGLRLPQLPHVRGQGQLQPRCARPDRGGVEEPWHPVADRPPDQPGQQVSWISHAVICRHG